MKTIFKISRIEKTLIILTCILYFSSGCSCEKKVKIALLTKLESGSIVGVSEVNAAKMFIENKGIKNMEIVPFDDAWDPEKTVKAYEAVKQNGINIIITSHTSSCAMVIKDAVNRDRVLMFVTGAATDHLSDSDDYIIRNIQDVKSEQKSIADYIKSKNISSLLVIRDLENTAYTEPALRHFRNYFSGGSLRVLDIQISKFNSEQLGVQVKKIKYDALYLLIGGHKAAAGSIAQLVQSINPPGTIIYTPWMKTPAIIETAGTSLDNSVFPSMYPARAVNPGVDSYFRRYREKFGDTPTFISLNVYSALQVLQAAINSGHTDPESIKKFIISSSSINTDFGAVLFNKYGDSDSPVYFITDIRREFR